MLRVKRNFVLFFFAIVVCTRTFSADEVVLETADFSVTTQDFERYLTAKGITGDKRERTLAKEGAVKTVFENMYVIRALAAKAERNPGIDQDEIEWMVRSYRERLLMNRQLELEVQSELSTKNWDALAEEEYKANKADYKVAEQLSAAHILIAVTDRSEEEAESRAKEVLTRLADGGDFAALAREYSDDSVSAARGGELDFFPRKSMVKPFEDAAFALTKPGEIAGPVKTSFGYHIIRFNERRPERQLSFEEAKARIVPQLKKRTEQSLGQDKVAAIKSGTVDLGLEVNLPLLKQIEQRYSKPVETEPKKQ